MNKPHIKSEFKGALIILAVVVVILLISLSVIGNARSQQSSLVQTPPLVTVKSSTPASSQVNVTAQPNPDSTDGTSVVASEQANLLCANAHGKLIEDRMYSKMYETVIPVMVYYPACENPDLDETLAYPTLYLLHGLGSDESQWADLGLVKEMDSAIAAGISPFIVIMPQIPEMAIWPSDKNAVLITEELIPFIDNRYPTLADRDYRATGGLSRGAAWALRIGLTHSDSFGKIGLHSLSLYDPETNHWAGILNEMETSEIPQLFMDSGKSDAELGSMQLLDGLLASLNVPHESTIFEGDHNDEYWSEHLPIYLEWYAQGW